MRSCERCKFPLVDDRAGYSNDGRLICTRVECQNVERMNKAIDDGRFELVDAEQFKTELASPALKDMIRNLELDLEIHGILLRPLRDEPSDADD